MSGEHPVPDHLFELDALRLTANRTFASWRLRGVHLRVLAPGEVAPGDRIEVLARPR